ncbi:hypothetical protein ACFPRL_31680 [Pseudoclavibacter helvolus]
MKPAAMTCWKRSSERRRGCCRTAMSVSRSSRVTGSFGKSLMRTARTAPPPKSLVSGGKS